ncbi:hypothetical protein PR003_g14920 [Phytophthora rubi]|uniref:Uncharacterized protein n=1 Tax=Phytophthora rubi TaxID=129364 RepID=A0A6A3N9T2_9STRA|nr:hypothetical protein PR002_g26465 [Phytophthora rubi]KAE9037074.1 hypothetical protein PR001_g8531 [Phytophthora rubi]KAE9331623.1 hypothetical protein PR003_g14920 [Phytophthora rubi]
MEDRAQGERLALAFWKEYGGVGLVPRDAVEALRFAQAARDASREALASHRELWKEVRVVRESNEEPRRGRRVSVGEDVPSGIGPYRSARVNYRPRSVSPGEQLFEAEPRMGRRGVGPDF